MAVPKTAALPLGDAPAWAPKRPERPENAPLGFRRGGNTRRLYASLSLDPSALRSVSLSRNIFTTTASADSCDAFTSQVSPSKVYSLSARAVRLYLTCLSVTVGFRIPQDAHRPCPASLLGSCSYGRAFAPRFLQVRLAAAPLRLATVTVTVSGQLLSDD